MVHHKRNSCRVCGENNLHRFLSLGPTPLANSFLRSQDDFKDEASYPLDVYFCESCSLVQLLDVIDPEVLFRDYIYVTGTSDTIAAHNVQYAHTVVDLLRLKRDDLVVEVASNDGSLLKCFQKYGVKTLGIEPASNISQIANAQGVETVNQFFNSANARQIRSAFGPVKAVIGNNVLAHVDESRDFLCGCRELLAEDGLVIIEVPNLGALVVRLEYDTIYHEHLCYFSATTLVRLCQTAGLSVIRIDHVPVHGGSLRIYSGRPEFYGSHAQEVLDLLEQENAAGLNDYGRYQQLACEVEKSRNALMDLLSSLKAQGKTIAAYGAPAKGNTLLNYCGIGTDLIPYTVDKNLLKVGTYTPGMHIPVLSADTLLNRQPDYVLILAWNFAQEIIRQQGEYQKRGGKFILPIPQAQII